MFERVRRKIRNRKKREKLVEMAISIKSDNVVYFILIFRNFGEDFSFVYFIGRGSELIFIKF